MARGKGLQKKVALDEDLAEFMGSDEATRPEILKKIWAHIRKHELQDVDNKRMIEPDDILAPILGTRKISMFKVMTCINEHVL